MADDTDQTAKASHGPAPNPAPDSAEQLQARGRAAVRALLIEPVEARGMRRGHGITQEAHAARLDRIAAALAYMTAENLATLRDIVLAKAIGPGRDTWPPEVAVIGWGRDLQAPPARDERIISSWLASIEGPAAQEAGWHVELYRFLCARRLPPGRDDARRLRDAAYDNARTRQVYAERVTKGVATPAERGWLAEYDRDRRAAEAIIAAGMEARQARAAAADGGRNAA